MGKASLEKLFLIRKDKTLKVQLINKIHTRMRTIIEKSEKRTYNSPMVKRIKLDNEISLALESAPDDPEHYSSISAPEYFNNDPFKTNLG